jgi:hypothetical protein
MKYLIDRFVPRTITLADMVTSARANEAHAARAYRTEPNADNYTWLAAARADLAMLLAQVAA